LAHVRGNGLTDAIADSYIEEAVAAYISNCYKQCGRVST